MKKLLDCINEYINLCNNQYQLSVYTGKSIENITLQFSIQDFLHLSGIEKIFSDPNSSQNPILAPIIKKFQYKNDDFIQYFLQNQKNSQVIQEGKALLDQCSRTIINKGKFNSKNYYVSDRIEELTKLSTYLSSGIYDKFQNNSNVSIYSWKKNTSKFNRPYESQISADFLVSFDRVVNGNTTGENVCFFIVNQSKENYSPVSIFPINFSYDNDGKIYEKQYEFTYAEEKTPIKTTILFSCSKQRINQITDELNMKQLFNAVKNLKKYRNNYALASQSGSQAKQDKTKKQYQRELLQIINFLGQSRFTPQMIIQVIQSLIDQKADKANEPFVPYIEQEINQVKAVAQQRGINTNVFKAQINPDGSLSVTIPPVSSVMSGLWNDIKSALKSFVTDIKKSFVQADTKPPVPRQNAKSKAPRPSSQARQSPPKPKQDKSDKPKKPPPNMDKNNVQQPKYIGRGTMLGGAKIIKQKQQSPNKNHDKTNDIPKKKKKNTSL